MQIKAGLVDGETTGNDNLVYF